MSQEPRYYRVGLFVLVGTGLLLGAILLLGGTDLLRTPAIFETYFDESVQGLEVGSPVKFRGVQLGSVSKIGFVNDYYEFRTEADDLKYGQMVLVRMKLMPSEDDPALDVGRTRRAGLQQMIDHGLRLRLAQQGITGTAYIEADYASPEDHPPMEPVWEPQVLYVPSQPSVLRAFSNAVGRLFARLEETPIEDVIAHLDELLLNANSVVEELDLVAVQDGAVELMNDLRETSGSAREQLDALNARAVSSDARSALRELEATLATVRTAVEDGRPGMQALLENLRVVSEDLRDLASTARKYPSVLLLGEPPPTTDPGGRQ